MEEKKLNDEEIVKELMNESNRGEWCELSFIDCVVELRVLKNAIDLIHRLQAENERLNDIEFTKEHCDLYKENQWLKAEIKRELAEHEEFTKNAKEEIERLTEEKLKVQDDLDNYHSENAELQKQVDELKNNKLKGEIIMKNANELMNEIEEQCCDCKAWSGTDCTRNPYTQGCLKDEKQVIECHGMLKGCDMVKQAVKDTAKEICDLILEHWEKNQFVECDWLRVAIAEKYGVKVE